MQTPFSNSLVLALPRPVPGSRQVSGTVQLIRELDVHQVLPEHRP